MKTGNRIQKLGKASHLKAVAALAFMKEEGKIKVGY